MESTIEAERPVAARSTDEEGLRDSEEVGSENHPLPSSSFRIIIHAVQTYRRTQNPRNGETGKPGSLSKGSESRTTDSPRRKTSLTHLAVF